MFFSRGSSRNVATGLCCTNNSQSYFAMSKTKSTKVSTFSEKTRGRVGGGADRGVIVTMAASLCCSGFPLGQSMYNGGRLDNLLCSQGDSQSPFHWCARRE